MGRKGSENEGEIIGVLEEEEKEGGKWFRPEKRRREREHKEGKNETERG